MYSPFVREGDWDSAAAQARDIVNTSYRRQLLLGWLPKFGRTQASVANDYSRQWLANPLRQQLLTSGPVGPCQWRERKFLARAIGTKRVHLLHLFRALEALKPETVLEVGAGNGVNLLAIAARYPAIRLTGTELTPGGVEAAQMIAAQEKLPDELLGFLPRPAARASVRDDIEFLQGDARRLPFGDSAFDLVFTSLALEQMEEIRDAALREISRVARSWVMMIEPFRDFNDEGIRRRYIRAQNYFSARVGDLRSYGLEAVFVSGDMPHKLTLQPAVVVARKQ